MSAWMERDKPAFIYKYSSAGRVTQIVNDLTFFFTPSASLKDLYEFAALSVFQEDPDSKYRVSAKGLIAQGWFDTDEEALEAARETLSEEAVDSGYVFFKEHLTAKLTDVRLHSGVTCFSSERNNQRLWGTYGDNHAGAVLEFSTSPAASHFARNLMQVIYTNSKLPLCPSELMTNAEGLDFWMLGILLCTKHIHWREEMEWRLLLLADSTQTNRERVVPFERTAITRIFLGPRMKFDDELALRAAARKHQPPIPVYARRIDQVLAREEYEGFELLESSEQFLYWASKHREGEGNFQRLV